MLSIVQTSVVVTADHHNPTVLHPHFLKTEGIVPPHLEVAEPPVCVAALALVKFKGGLTFLVDPVKLQVSDTSPPAEANVSLAPGCAERYLRALPHVQYKAVGLNFTALLDATDPEHELIDRFLKPGPWNAGQQVLGSMGVRLVYPVGGLAKSLQLSLDPGTVNKEGVGTARGIIVGGNYHSDLSGDRSVDQAVGVISRFLECYAHFRGALRSFFDE